MPFATGAATTRWLPRAVVAFVVLAASALAWREGGGADERRPPPRANPVLEGGVSADAAGVTGGVPTGGASRGPVAFEVKQRLIDALGGAHADVPTLGASQPYMNAYWRKMPNPWVHLSGAGASLALDLALRTTPVAERQLSIAMSGGDSWVPKARVWNMNEGSFDEREAIFAPTPATLSFRVVVPSGAHLRVSPGIALNLPLTTVFEVGITAARGNQQIVSTTRVQGDGAHQWTDIDVDLSAFAGQRVDMRLTTRAEKPGPTEKRWTPAPVVVDAGADDAGVVERMPVPPMSLALWGDPIIVAQEPSRAPYNVLWIVVDALRPDVVAALHDPAEDAAKRGASKPPLDAWLPLVPGLTPNIDRLAGRGVRFTHAWSAATWTRPGTLAMLSGERSSELGIDTTNWILQPAAVARYYAMAPPLGPLVLRRAGMVTAAFVNNFFMAGYVPVGVDMGFERFIDHRFRTRDTAEITRDAVGWLGGHAHDRFFLFVNFNSPHEPYDPPKEMLARIPPPPAGPRDGQVRAYMAEAAKDDAAIGEVLGALDTLGLTDSTLVILTADHGETLSSAHDGEGMENIHQRFHHAVGNFEETARIPLVMALPGVLDGGKAIGDRVRNTDIVPTVMEAEGLEPDPRMSGRSVLPLVRGTKEPQPRVVLTEGRQSRAILWDHFRFVAHDDDEPELFDLDADPGERTNIASTHPDVVAEMKARLAAAVTNTPTADAADPGPRDAAPATHFRFAGAAQPHRVSGELRAGDTKTETTLSFEPAGVGRDAFHQTGRALTFSFTTSPDAIVGFDARTDPPGAALQWKLFLDDAPWPDGAVFAGPFGLPASVARTGIVSDEAREEAYATAPPFIDPARDLGMFLTRDPPPRRAGAAGTADDDAVPPTLGDAGSGAAAAAREMQQVLEQWGYAHGSH